MKKTPLDTKTYEVTVIKTMRFHCKDHQIDKWIKIELLKANLYTYIPQIYDKICTAEQGKKDKLFSKCLLQLDCSTKNTNYNAILPHIKKSISDGL